jgi:hypothetical protein
MSPHAISRAGQGVEIFLTATGLTPNRLTASDKSTFPGNGRSPADGMRSAAGIIRYWISNWSKPWLDSNTMAAVGPCVAGHRLTTSTTTSTTGIFIEVELNGDERWVELAGNAAQEYQRLHAIRSAAIRPNEYFPER